MLPCRANSFDRSKIKVKNALLGIAVFIFTTIMGPTWGGEG